jgi:hypothetical protein
MMFEAAHKPDEPSAALNAQAGLMMMTLIATRMRRARAFWGKQSVAAL